MKIVSTIILILISALSLSGFSSADDGNEKPDYKELVDIVYEWTPYGNMIQVGNYTILGFKSVWMDQGNNNIVAAAKGDIKQGGLAKVFLIDRDDNGFWRADKIIVFSGKGRDTAIKNLSLMKRKELLGLEKATRVDYWKVTGNKDE